MDLVAVGSQMVQLTVFSNEKGISIAVEVGVVMVVVQQPQKEVEIELLNCWRDWMLCFCRRPIHSAIPRTHMRPDPLAIILETAPSNEVHSDRVSCRRANSILALLQD